MGKPKTVPEWVERRLAQNRLFLSERDARTLSVCEYLSTHVPIIDGYETQALATWAIAGIEER